MRPVMRSRAFRFAAMSAEAWAAMQPRHAPAAAEVDPAATCFSAPGRPERRGRQGIEFDSVHATLQINDWTFCDVAVRYNGNNSYFRATRSGSDKISLKVDFNKYVKGQKLAGLTTIRGTGAADDLLAGVPHRRRPARETPGEVMSHPRPCAIDQCGRVDVVASLPAPSRPASPDADAPRAHPAGGVRGGPAAATPAVPTSR